MRHLTVICAVVCALLASGLTAGYAQAPNATANPPMPRVVKRGVMEIFSISRVIRRPMIIIRAFPRRFRMPKEGLINPEC